MISFTRERSAPFDSARAWPAGPFETAKECLAETGASIEKVVNKNPAVALAVALAAGALLGWLIKRR